MSCFGSRLRRRSFCTDLTVEVGQVGSLRTVHGGRIPPWQMTFSPQSRSRMLNHNAHRSMFFLHGSG